MRGPLKQKTARGAFVVALLLVLVPMVLVGSAVATVPALTVPGDFSVEATSASGAIVTYSVTSDLDPTPLCNHPSGTEFTLGATLVTCTATDPNPPNDTATASFTVTVVDTQAPVFSNVPSTITKEATSSSGAIATFTDPTATDAVTGVRPVNCVPSSGSTFPLGTNTVTCSANDGSGHSSSATFDVVVQDTQAPVFSNVPSTITKEATSSSGAIATFTDPTATDAVTGVRPVNCVPSSGSTFPLGTNTVTCSANDGSGHSSSATFDVVVQDTQAPVFSNVPSTITKEATSSSGAIATFTDPTATDAVTGVRPVNCVPSSGSTFPLGTNTVTCSANDGSGHSSSATFDVVVQDTQAPVFSNVPSTITKEATSSSGAIATFTDPTATDAVTGVRPVNCVPSSGSTFPLGTNTVTCSANDGSGHSSSATFDVVVQDTQAPVASIDTKPANPTNQMTAKFGFSATDDVSASFTFQCALDTPTFSTCPANPVTYTGLSETSHTFMVRAVDDANNVSLAVSFTWTVNADAPGWGGGASNITREATGPAGATVTYASPTATDPVSNLDLPVTCSPLSGSVFPIAATTVSCQATADNGTKGTLTFKVTVQDTTAPAISGTPVQIAATTDGSGGVVVSYTLPTASDIVDGTRSVSCAPVSGSTFPVGTTTVNCSASDTRSNTAHTSFPVVVSLPAPPVAVPALVVPGTVKAEATSGAGAIVNYSVTTSDGSAPTIVCSPAPGSLFPFGSTTVTCTATSASGGTAVRNFTVSVRDTKAPIFSGKYPDVVKKIAKRKAVAVSFKAPVAKDAVDGTVAAVCTPGSRAKFKFGVTLVTCRASDAAGNARSVSFHVRVALLPKGPYLLAPVNGVALKTAPRFSWTAAKGASYYNFQLWYKGHKVLSVWPRTTHFKLKQSWKFAGTRHRLSAGSYNWFVWPGFGQLANARYGGLIGQRSFSIG